MTPNAPPPLRLLAIEDAGEAHALHALCFDPAETWSTKAFEESLALASTLGLAAADDDTLSGMILVQRTPPDAEILTIAVHPARRRQGLARALLNGAAQLLGGYGVDKLLLDVAADNAPALAFYKTQRFTIDGRRRNYYSRRSGGQVDALLLSRAAAGHLAQSEA